MAERRHIEAENALEGRSMECTVKWVGPDGMSFVAETGCGHVFVMDGAPEGGGAIWARGRWKRCWQGLG
jgi:hypothetical protein